MGTVVVTGVNGFAGGHLAADLARHGWSVTGVGLGEVAASARDHLSAYVEHDLVDSWPDVDPAAPVVHLAALSAVGPSFADPQAYIGTNSAMVTHLGERQLAHGVSPRVIVVSSGAVYDTHEPGPISEDGAVALGSPYAVSKVLVENQATYYRSRGLDWVVVRPFNHLGPGQGPGFLLPDLVLEARRAAASSSPMRVGDLSSRRDYTDVRDVVRAYRLLLEATDLDHRLFNVCSARDVSGQEVLEALRACGVARDLEVEVDPARVRPHDPRVVRGDAGRIAAAVGWRADVPLAQSVADFVAASAC